jgi:choline dehydrogenase-like flavoprotein
LHIDLEQSGLAGNFESNVCIIGAGIAGLTLATRLAEQGIAVHLLEAGGLTPEERSQSLYRAEMAGDQHRGVHEGRFRIFGGSSTQWGGQLLPFTADTFDPPPDTGSLRWPIEESELTPFYDEVQRILGVDDLPFTSDLLPALGYSALPASDRIRTRYSKWAPFNRRNLAQTIGQQVLAHPKITLFTHANVTSLHTDPLDDSRIGFARVVNYTGRQFSFKANHFVVCTGTIESSRLLLCSPGVPNPHDQIGRYFHDHLSMHVAKFLPPMREQILDRLGPFFVDGTLHTFKMEATPELRAREHLLAVMAHLVIVEPDDSGAAALRNLLRSLQHGRLKQAIAENLLPSLKGASDIARLLYFSRLKKRRAVTKRASLYLTVDLEQQPSPENRIRISGEHKDALGLPMTVIDWRISPAERNTAARFTEIIRNYLRELGLEPQEWETGPVTDTLHPMGGLRMGDDPAASVVDRDLTVHGLTNLSVASCAVFPSGSSSNPTFTMMALSLRLAKHLAAKAFHEKV